MAVTSIDPIAPLFVPATRPERFEKAARSGADAVIVDLEDAVPADAKPKARDALTVDFTRLPVVVRINGVGTPWHAEDLEAVARLPFAAVMVPKAESAVTLAAIASVINRPIIALIETAVGLAAARSIAAVRNVRTLAFGSIDFCADVGCAHLREVLLLARSEIVLASRLAGKSPPIDGVTTVIDDAELAADDARHARAMGFGGKLCIHPKQIGPVLKGFSPDAGELEWAKRVLASGEGATAVEGAMVDAPVRLRARRILAQAEVATAARSAPRFWDG